MSFNLNDRVKVTAKVGNSLGKTGKVTTVYPNAKSYLVLLETDNRTSGFFEDELELVDLKRESLIELAETLDEARKQANAIDELTIQSQHGVYGQIAQALIYTLAQIVGAGYDSIRYDHAGMVYGSILDGNTVREALASVVL
jgi:hypothetical protein